MRYDIKLLSPVDDRWSRTPIVASGTTASINAGEPTKGADATAASPWTGAVSIMADGDGTTSQVFTGIAKSDSTETTTAAGTVQVWLPYPGLVYQAQAKTASLANTDALLQGLFRKRVVLDLTSTRWTVDTAAADASTNGIVIVGGEFLTSTIYFYVSSTVSMLS